MITAAIMITQFFFFFFFILEQAYFENGVEHMCYFKYAQSY